MTKEQDKSEYAPGPSMMPFLALKRSGEYKHHRSDEAITDRARYGREYGQTPDKHRLQVNYAIISV